MLRQPYELIAGVDLGSSSFRMVVARVSYTDTEPNVQLIDALREPVRLGADLDSNNILRKKAQQRALDCLARFGERLRDFPPNKVRAVATNAVRVAKNATEFIEKAQSALGFDIDIISGAEEARLVYSGVARQLPNGLGPRLVVDIGGGSTECIIGQDHRPILAESLNIGCVSQGQAFFPDGLITPERMIDAVFNARMEVAVLQRRLVGHNWTHTIGSSGTARSLAEICVINGWSQHGLSLHGLKQIRRILLQARHIDKLSINGLKEDRRYNLPGGLAIMTAVFQEFKLHSMEVTEGALRQGLLYDLLGRTSTQDMRELTVRKFAQRYEIDPLHSQQVKKLALNWFDQIATPGQAKQRLLLDWAATLHEVGLSISHNGHHKHSAYILSKSDMPGFSKKEQALLANWILAHTGRLGKMVSSIRTTDEWIAPMCLRLAALILRGRPRSEQPQIIIQREKARFEIHISKKWIDKHPLTHYGLFSEIEEWKKIGFSLEIKFKK